MNNIANRVILFSPNNVYKRVQIYIFLLFKKKNCNLYVYIFFF